MRPKKYHSEEERRTVRLAQMKAYRERNKGKSHKKKGKSKSWLSGLAKQLDSVSASTTGTTVSSEDQTPPDRPGEPFADLPPLDLPGTSAGSAGSEEKPEGSPTPEGATSTPSPEAQKSKVDEKQAFLNTEQLAEMAEGMVKQGTLKLGEYAVARGFFALGEFFADLAGKSAAIIVRANAAKLDIAPEEAAAWIVVGVAGTNGVQAFRAYRADRLKEEEKKNEPARAPAQPQQQHVNGAPAEPYPRPEKVDDSTIVLRPGALV